MSSCFFVLGTCVSQVTHQTRASLGVITGAAKSCQSLQGRNISFGKWDRRNYRIDHNTTCESVACRKENEIIQQNAWGRL